MSYKPEWLNFRALVSEIAVHEQRRDGDIAEELLAVLRDGRIQVQYMRTEDGRPLPTDWRAYGSDFTERHYYWSENLLLKRKEVEKHVLSSENLSDAETGTSAPIPRTRNFKKEVIEAVTACFANGHRPPSNIQWKVFADMVRKQGGVSDGTRSWDDKTIERCYRAMGRTLGR